MIEDNNSKVGGVGLFVMPRSSADWLGAEAMWITAAGWATAVQRRLGKAWVLTTDRLADPKEVIYYPLIKEGTVAHKSLIVRLLPEYLTTLLKDIYLWRKSRSKSNYASLKSLDLSTLRFVWEQHDLFEGPGRELANKFKVPLIKYVHAPQVWESGRWGVRRPIWGHWLERMEAQAIAKADVVACVSDEVRMKLIGMGIQANKIVISPMAADPELFNSSESNKNLLKDSLHLNKRIVIGWTGSFRRFHGLDLLVRAFSRVYTKHPEVSLLLVGDGKEMGLIRQLVLDLKLMDAVVFAGRRKFAEIPALVSVFDIAVVSARAAEGFHYSPLKLREYLAAGKATLAPRAGEIPTVFSDKSHLLLYQPGDIEELAEKILTLVTDEKLRVHLEQNGKQFALGHCTWQNELDKIMKHLSISSDL